MTVTSAWATPIGTTLRCAQGHRYVIAALDDGLTLTTGG
jgi:hypothetical protein